jgi:hypothetical protein
LDGGGLKGRSDSSLADAIRTENSDAVYVITTLLLPTHVKELRDGINLSILMKELCHGINTKALISSVTALGI